MTGRKAAAVMLAAAVAVMALAGCGSKPAPRYAQVCLDQNGVRVDDLRCEQASFDHWGYLPPGRNVPPYGQPVPGAVSQLPAGKRVYRPAPGGRP